MREDPPAETLTDDGEPATFVVAQAHAPAVQLGLEHAVLFPQEFDEIALFPFDPTDQRGDDQRQRKHARSLRQSGIDGVIGHYGPIESDRNWPELARRPAGRRR